MSNHAWCSDPARDEAVRAAEDGRLGPLPTLEEAIADPFTKTARICETESAVEPVIPAADAQGGGVAGLRTERVTLEVTYRSNFPPRLWGWGYVFQKMLYSGESVRVVEEGDTDEWAERCARILDERDAARAECERLRAEKAADWKAACESALAASKLVGTLKARVAELESAAKLAPGANAGGEQEPVGYMMAGPFERRCFRRLDEAFAYRRNLPEIESASMELVPLYAAPQPPRGWLTEEERNAVEDAADRLHNYDSTGPRHSARVLRSLLARSTPPKVKVPNLLQHGNWQSRDGQWIAAIREAGVEVE